jgi:REP element-mobilizing transposase RayT
MGRRLRFLPYSQTLVEITNRTIHGRYLLKPNRRLREITLGALARAQQRYGVAIHAFVFLSNHYHLLISVTDARQMAAFVGYFESKLAKEVGRLTGWREKIWGRRYSAIPVSLEVQAQVGRLKYLLSQGVKEGLVLHPADWPGAQSVQALLEGAPLKGVWHDRTAEYLARQRGHRLVPEKLCIPEVIELSPLPCWVEESGANRRDLVRHLVAEIMADARASKPNYRKLLRGPRPTDRPRHSNRSPAPWFHCASKAVRLELRRAYSDFLDAYREAFRLLNDSIWSAAFPAGCFPPSRPFVTAS